MHGADTAGDEEALWHACGLDRVHDGVHRELVPPRGIREAAAQPAPVMLH